MQGDCGKHGNKKWCNITEDPDQYAIYDSHPDKLSTATGIQIPVIEWDKDGEYQFEICLFGESDMIEINKMDVGWAFNIEYGGVQDTWDYGYICDNNIELPDLCGSTTTTYMDQKTGMKMSIGRHDVSDIVTTAEMEFKFDQSDDDATLIKGGDQKEDALSIVSNGEHEIFHHHHYTLWNVVTAHQTFLFVAVLVVLGVGIFVTSFAHCIKYKTDGKAYGHMIKFVESDVDHDDVTDSEMDEDLLDDQ